MSAAEIYYRFLAHHIRLNKECILWRSGNSSVLLSSIFYFVRRFSQLFEKYNYLDILKYVWVNVIHAAHRLKNKANTYTIKKGKNTHTRRWLSFLLDRPHICNTKFYTNKRSLKILKNSTKLEETYISILYRKVKRNHNYIIYKNWPLAIFYYCACITNISRPSTIFLKIRGAMHSWHTHTHIHTQIVIHT